VDFHGEVEVGKGVIVGLATALEELSFILGEGLVVGLQPFI
jgi:hypothetical protein